MMNSDALILQDTIVHFIGLMTSWHIRCISGLALCTDLKSRSELFTPDATEDADPPPTHILIAAHQIDMRRVPSGSGFF